MADTHIDITAIVVRERSRLLSFIRRRVGDQMDAEDILQDVLFAFAEAFRLPIQIDRASAWLHQVARHRIIDRFRKRREEQLVDADAEGGDLDIRLDVMLPAPAAGPDAEYARTVLLEELQTAIDELPHKQRLVFIAHELEGKSFREMSDQSGTSVNTLLARKRYAVVYLRSRLRDAFENLEN
jgi:RNA polymerase sigma factor (sigma-70 family)